MTSHHARQEGSRPRQGDLVEVGADRSYRFPLSLIYGVLCIVFAEGVEVIFPFWRCTASPSRRPLARWGRGQATKGCLQGWERGERDWWANAFVLDAYEMRMQVPPDEVGGPEKCRADPDA